MIAGLTAEEARAIAELAKGVEQRLIAARAIGNVRIADIAGDVAQIREIARQGDPAGVARDRYLDAFRREIAKKGAPTPNTGHTVKIKRADAPNGYVLIDAGDFDPAVHERAE